MAFALVFAPRNGLLPIRSTLGRLRSSGKPPALPPPDVPFLDTRGFVPTRPPDEPRGDSIQDDAPPEDGVD
jgi:hypothetical protein